MHNRYFLALAKDYSFITALALYFLVFVALFQTTFGQYNPKLIQFHTSDIDHHTKKITLTFVLPDKDFIYKEFIHCSIQEPSVILSEWKADKPSIDYYDPSFNETKEIFNETFSLTMTATISDSAEYPLHFYCSYYRKFEKKINRVLFNFSFSPPVQPSPIQEKSNEIETKTPSLYHPVSLLDAYINNILTIVYNCLIHFHHYAYLYFLILIFLFCTLIIILYHYKNKLQKHTSLNEILIFTQLLLVIPVIGYITIYLISIGFPQIGFICSWLSFLYIGFLYIKKSSTVEIELLHTLSTLLGIVLIAGSFILLFKALQL